MKISLDYLAGIIDGEGNIQLSKQKRCNCVYYNLTVRISNTNFCLINLLQNEFGGKIHTCKKYNEKWKIGYILSWNGENAQDLLKKIEDKLIVKRRKAELCISFPLRIEYSNFLGIYNDLILIRQTLYDEIKLCDEGKNVTIRDRD